MIRYNRKQEQHINKKPVSIIVTAWQTSPFIEDCLDSIESQTYFASNDNFEVLVGIDGCAQTLKKIEDITYKYRNLKVFMMESHVGTYVTSNTLLNLASKDHIIRFDSDDIMLPEMVEEVMAQTDNYDFIQYGFKTFTGNKSQTFERKFWAACGSVYYNRSFIDAAGGYRPWLCSADLELIRRTENSPFRRGIIEKRLFLLRSHPNSLASKADTKLGGGYRLSLERGIRVFKPHENIKIERKITGIKSIEYDIHSAYLKVEEAKSGVFNKELPAEVRNEARYSSQTKNAQGISILVTAWQTQNYIEKCLDSIEDQIYFKNNDNYEILLGIDGCQETLAKVKEILEKYRNLRVFMMEENVGTYVTTNTLLDLVSYDNIIRFDSDDYMMPHMISEVMAASEEYDFIRFHFDDFDDVRKEMRPRAFLAMGAVYYKKWVIEKAGGYKDWRCNADLELLKRISNSDIRFGEIKKPLFVRRIHPNSLSERSETGIRSFFRKNLTNRVRIYDKGEGIKIEKVVGEYKEVKDPKSLKLIFSITTYNRLDFLKKTINSWYNSIDKNHEWTLIIADDNSNDGTKEYLENLSLEGIHIIILTNDHRGVHHQTNTIFSKALSLDFDIGFKSDDDLIFLRPGWDNNYTRAIQKTGYDHLIFYDQKWGERRKELRTPVFKNSSFQNYVNIENVQGALWTFSKKVLEKVGFFDIEKFGLCGLGHVDFSARCCRAGFNNIDNPFDILDSNIYIALNKEKYISHNQYRNIWNTPDKITNKKKLLNQSRIYIPYNEIPYKMDGKKLNGGILINEYFDHIYCVNLDRRPDKWDTVKKRLDSLEIEVHRFSAIDGDQIPYYILNEYEINKYAVGCILSHYEIIKDAKNNDYKKILILEDDVLFIENFHEEFQKFINKIESWKIIYLGSSQWYWAKAEMKDGFYKSKTNDGTFAYAVDRSVYDDILNTKDVKDKPIDYKLWSIQEKYYNECYTAFPNLIISDVSDSNIRDSRDNQTHRIKMKWNLKNYQS